jgi:N-acetylglucosamine-6-sulfatase
MKKILTLCLAIVISVTIPFNFSMAVCTPPGPVAVKTLTNVTECSVTVNWNTVANATYYELSYRKINPNGNWTIVNVGNVTTYTVSGLIGNTQYAFKLQGFCADGTAGATQNGKNTYTLACSLPSNVQVSNITNTSATVAWSAACSQNAFVEYRPFGTTSWTILSAGTSINLTGLVAGTMYEVRVNSCDTAIGTNWTPITTFATPGGIPHPNVIFILLDDSRFDWFSCNGAASFFHTPNIDRIANEGARFTNNYSIYSLCAPSRASLLTGKRANVHHVIDNSTQAQFDKTLPRVPKILHDNGIYTGLIGKNHEIQAYADGDWDYWYEVLSNDDATKKNVNLNSDGPSIKVTGLSSNFITDAAIDRIHNVNSQFYLYLPYRAPHTPLVFSSVYDIYRSFPLQLKPDTAKYTQNYASWSYLLPPGKNYAVGSELQEQYYDTYAVISELDYNIGRILNELTATGKLDNTIIIFSSDNGYMYGEHHFNMKRIAYQPSTNLPLFVRYPTWFAPGTVVTDLVRNIDIPTTILDAVGIPNTFGMDGYSLRNIANHTATVDEIYYHSFYTTENQYQNLPHIHGIWDLQNKYLYSGCSSTTEEFFDLVNDPLELINQINNPAFSSTIQSYRDRLTAAKIAANDLAVETILPCSLVVNTPRVGIIDLEEGDGQLHVYPNPTRGRVNVTGNADEEMRVYSANNKLLMKGIYAGNIDLSPYANGTYIIKTKTKECKVTKQ